MSQQLSDTLRGPGQEQPDPSFAEAAEALASLAASPVRPIGASAAVAMNKRNALGTKPPRKRAKQGSVNVHLKGQSVLPTVKKSSSKPSSPKKKKKSPPSPHAPHAAAAPAVIFKTDPLPLAAAGAPDPSLLLAALADSKSLDGPARLSLQREVADIRMRYNTSGDLETLLREARDVDARLKRIGIQVKREDLLTEPNVSHLPSDHPLLPTLLAIMAQGQGQVPAAAVGPPASFSFEDPKLAMALLAQQQHARSQGHETSNIPAGLPSLSQLNDQQLLLLRQLQLQKEHEEKVGLQDRVEQASFGAQDDGQQAEVLRMLLLHKLQQQHRDDSAIERTPVLEKLLPLLQQASTFSLGAAALPSGSQPSSGLENLMHLLRHAAASSEASASGAFPFLGAVGSASSGQQHPYDMLGLPQDSSQQVRDLELEREQLLLRLARQAQQQLHQDSRSPDAASVLSGLADAGEQLPILNLLTAQLLLKQQQAQHQAQHQAASNEQERVLSILQALQDSKQQAPLNAGLSEHEQLLGLLLKAQNQERQSHLPSAQQQIGSAAYFQLAQLQASLQQKAQEEEEAAAAAAIQSSLSQGLAQLVNSNLSLGLGASETSSAYPPHQVQLLAMLSALQQQQRQQQ